MRSILICFLVFFLNFRLIAQAPDHRQWIEFEKKSAESFLRVPDHHAVSHCNIVYDRCEWTVNPNWNDLFGIVTTYFIPDQAINTLELDLSLALVTDSILYHGSGISFSHSANDLLVINFPATIPAASIDSVSIYYHGVPQSTGFGSYVSQWHQTASVLWTLSEPYGAKDWWPCIQDLNDKIDSIDIIVHCPDGNRTASNGLLISETTNSGVVTAHWKHRYPIATYLVGLASTNYFSYTDTVLFQQDTVPIVNYVYPEDTPACFSTTHDLVAVMQLYDTLFGAYAFSDEKYGQARIAWGGGMEHQTMTFIGDFWPELTAHELAHHWFGDPVTCGSWSDIWLNEGWAEYLSGLVHEHFTPQDWLAWKEGIIHSVTSAPDGSVYCSDTSDINRIFNGRLTYDKGSYLAHMLRWVCGDSAFFAGMKNYLNDPALRYHFSRTAKLQSALEQSSGKSLNTFFNQWYYGEGFPSYDVQWSQDVSNVLTVQINQSTSHASVGFYEMPVPIRFRNNTQDTTIVFNHLFSGQTFHPSISFHADSADFDPERWILSANNSIHIGIATIPENNLLLFPSPANQELHIQYSGNIQLTSFELFGTDGKLIRDEPVMTGSNGQLLVHVEDLSPGIYIIRINTASGSIFRKFGVFRN